MWMNSKGIWLLNMQFRVNLLGLNIKLLSNPVSNSTHSVYIHNTSYIKRLYLSTLAYREN